MKKFIGLLIILCLLGFVVFAQGQVEATDKLTSLEGTIEIIQVPGDKPTVFLILEDGTKTELMISEAAMIQLQLQNRERVQIEGVFLGSGTQEKLFARMMVRNKERVNIQDPIQLSAEEQNQLRVYQQEMQRTQTQTEQGGQNEAPSGSGNSSGAGKGKN